MNVRRSITALGAFFVLALGLSACGGGVPGNAVVDMAGNPITLNAFNHWMYVAAKGQASQSPGSPVIVPNDPPGFKNCIAQARKEVPTVASDSNSQLKAACNQLFTALSSQVLDFLIKAYWYQADAARQHIKVTNAQVQNAFNSAKQQQFPNEAAFQTFLSQSGQTLQDILYRFRVNLIFRQLIAKASGAAVSSAAIANYYNSHKSQFGKPQTRDIRIVLAKTQAQANAAKAALASGQSWNAVAKKYSSDPTSKNTGGLLSGISKGQEDKALDTAAFSAPANTVLGPVQGQFGWYVFEVTKITPGTQQTLAQATPVIRQQLVSQQQTNAQTAVDNNAKKHWQRQTKCRSPYAMADCSSYKPPKGSTATSPTTGTG